MPDSDPYICVHCGSRFAGPPAALVRRPSGDPGPVCADGLLAQMPSRFELEQHWLEQHLGSPLPSND